MMLGLACPFGRSLPAPRSGSARKPLTSQPSLAREAPWPRFRPTSSRRGLFPEIEPFAYGWMPTRSTHEVYTAKRCGGRAAVRRPCCTAARAGAINPGMRRFFPSGQVAHGAVRPARLRPLASARGVGRQRYLEADRGHRAPARTLRRRRSGPWSAAPGGDSTLALKKLRDHTIRMRVDALILRGVFLLTKRELYVVLPGRRSLDGVSRCVGALLLCADHQWPKRGRLRMMSAYYKRLTEKRIDHGRSVWRRRQSLGPVGKATPSQLRGPEERGLKRNSPKPSSPSRLRGWSAGTSSTAASCPRRAGS